MIALHKYEPNPNADILLILIYWKHTLRMWKPLYRKNIPKVLVLKMFSERIMKDKQ